MDMNPIEENEVLFELDRGAKFSNLVHKNKLKKKTNFKKKTRNKASEQKGNKKDGV